MLLFLVKNKSWIILALLLFVIGTQYYLNSNKENNIVELQKAIDTQVKVIENYEIELKKQTLMLAEEKANIKIVRKVQKELSKEKVELQKNLKVLENKFNDHDTEKLIYNKPELIEKIINDATKKKTDCFNSNFTDC